MSHCANWFAKIKWADSDKPENVPVSDIRNFNPSDPNDFRRDHWSRVKGPEKYFDDGKKHSAFALIGCLAESEAELEARSARVRFSAVLPPDDEPLSTCSESEQKTTKPLTTTSRNNAVAVQQKKAALQKEIKHNKSSSAFQRFAAEIMHTEDDASSDQENEDMESLRKKIRKLENQLKDKDQLRQKRQDEPSTSLKKSFGEIQVELKSAVQSAVQAAVETAVQAAVENAVKGALQSAILPAVQNEVDKLKNDLKLHLDSGLKEGITSITSEAALLGNILSTSDYLNSLRDVQTWVNSLQIELEES